MKCTTRSLALVAFAVALFVLVQPAAAVTLPSEGFIPWHVYNFEDGNSTGWSGGSIVGGAYKLSWDDSTSWEYSFQFSVPSGADADEYCFSGVFSSGSYVIDMIVKLTNSSGTYTLGSNPGNTNWRFNFTVPYDPGGMNITFTETRYAYQADYISVDDYVGKLGGTSWRVQQYGAEAAWDGDDWSGGSVSSATYTNTSTAYPVVLNMTGTYFAGGSTVAFYNISYSFSASSSRTVTIYAGVGGTEVTVATLTGTSGSISYRPVLVSGSSSGWAYVRVTSSGSLTAQSLTLYEATVVHDPEGMTQVVLYDEVARVPAYNSSLTYTYRAYDESGTYTEYGLGARVNIIPEVPDTAQLWVSYGSTGYFRELSSETIVDGVQNFYLCPVDRVRVVDVSILDFIGFWGPLQDTRVILYDQSRDHVITEGRIGVGYDTVVCPMDGGIYFFVLQNAYSTYNYGLYYCLSDSLTVSINFAPAELQRSINATRVDWDTIKTVYYDPQNLTYNASISITSQRGTEYEDTSTGSFITWEVNDLPDVLLYKIEVTAWVQGVEGDEQVYWVRYIGITGGGTNETEYAETTTPLTPPVSLTLEIGGFPTMGTILLFAVTFISFMFPPPYFRYSLLFLGGVALFMAYSGWLPSIPSAGWMLLGVICILAGVFMKRRL